MFYIGCHLSVARGYAAMGRDALSVGATTFQFFTRNPRGAKAKDLNPADMSALRTLLAENSFGPLVAHAPYTLNPCSPDPRVRELAGEMITDDLRRMAYLPGSFYNFHPGSHVGHGVEAGVAEIAALLNRVLSPTQSTVVLLETMAGKGSEVGGSFAELRAILDRVEQSEQVGICMDSCHLSDAGYDLANNLDGVLEEFDQVVGLERLRAFHLNDSLNPSGSRKDRHARLGEGFLGLDALVSIINHPALRGLPFLLETPCDLEGHGREIALLKTLRT